MKKFLITLSIILGILLISLVGYYFLVTSNSGVVDTIPLGIRNFLPFGGSGGSLEIPQNTISEENQPLNPVNFTQKLRKISTEPVAGAGLFDSKNGTTVRYIERATGHIYDVELFSSLTERISNTTLPQVYDALWGTSSSTFIATYLKNDNETVETYALSLKKSTSTPQTEGKKYSVNGSFLQFNIKEISTNENNIFYTYIDGVNSVGIVSTTLGTNKKQVWISPIKEILSQFVNTTTVAVTTKPSENISGFLYFINTTNGKNQKIIGDIQGLSTITSPDAKNVLALEQSQRGDVLYKYIVSDKTFTNITPTTFPEKCVWSKKDTNIVYCAVPKEKLVNVSLTNWYKGLTTFTDDIWRYDLKNNISSVVIDIQKEGGESVDVIEPQLSQNEKYVLFVNKRNGSLWSLDVEQ